MFKKIIIVIHNNIITNKGIELCNSIMLIVDDGSYESNTYTTTELKYLCVHGRPVKRIPYSLDQTPLSISRRSRIIAAPLEVLNKIVAALEE
jgi:hypothetical protein